DFSKGALAPEVKGAWTPDPPGWSVRRQDDRDKGQTTLTVLQGNKPLRPFTFPRGTEVNQFVALPSREPLDQPLLVVATYTPARGEPLLEVYNARTGDLLRNLRGHLARITALAFSADGKLVASAAEDQTVAVWTLANLGNVLDKLGGLPGLAV